MIHVILLFVAAAWFSFSDVAADENDSSAGWNLIKVPGANSFSGVGWYRSWVKVPDSYFAPHERNLFEESVGIYVRDLAGAHEVWVNGKMIGSAGSFPPEYRSGGKELHRHKVPVGTLRKAEWNEIAIRVNQQPGSDAGGFLGDPPFIMDYFLEGVFSGDWEFRIGDNYKPGPAQKSRPPRATFDNFQESSRILGRGPQVHGPSLPPVESAARLRPATGFAVDLLLNEPLVAQPTHFSFDERGRLWVAQYRQYPYPAGLKMLSRDKYYRAHYDKVPPPPPNHAPGADIISVHEDTDLDGTYDKHKVFADGLSMANSVVHGRGGVWVMHTPYLLFYPDRNEDDIPDGPPEVRLAGFGFEDTHSVANGLAWGPDGWLYGGQGSTTSCRVTRPGIDPPDAAGVYFEGCMVWRYHPETRAFEIFAEGGGNTFGLEFDAQGRLHSGHNGSGTRGFHFVQGGFYEMQGVDPGKFGPPRNPYAFGVLPMMRTTNNAVRFTHFGAFAEGTAIPQDSAGLLFSLDPLHNVVLRSRRLPRGATFVTVDLEPALRSDDEAFRPLYIANAPDGSLFLSDMCEFYIAHGQHYQNQIDPTTGRIYRLRGKEAVLERDINLQGKTTDQLITLLSHGNKWHRQTAVRLLAERKDPESMPKLRDIIDKSDGVGALHALWALYQVSRFAGEEETVKKALRHPYALVRIWTARLLGDEYGSHRGLGAGNHSRSSESIMPRPLYDALMAQARLESDYETLSQFASTARRLDAAQAIPLAGAIMNRDGLENDAFIPHLSWWVFEAHIPSGNQEVLQFFRQPGVWNFPVVFHHVLPRLARRYAVEGKRADLLLCAELFELAPSQKEAMQLMKGVDEAFRGRPIMRLPDELLSALTKSGQAPLPFRLKQGDPVAIAEALKVLSNPKADTEGQLQLVRIFGDIRHPEAVPALLSMVSARTSSLARAALASLSSYDEESIGSKIIDQLPSLTGNVQTAAFNTLASRGHWSLQLLNAIQTGSLKRTHIPDEISNRLRASKDQQVQALATKLLPQVQPVPVEFQDRINQITAVLQRAPGNPYAGESAYDLRCAACHKLFFKGGNIGPDLTAYQRDNLGTLLPSIVNPNAEIREGYQYYNVETKDGRSLSGFFVDRDNQVTILRGLDGENSTLRAAEIQDLQPVGRSLMPEGLLEGMTDQELRDLFAYLRISQPITN